MAKRIIHTTGKESNCKSYTKPVRGKWNSCEQILQGQRKIKI